MSKFLIEVRHEPDVLACARVVRTFLVSGSHFLAQADWGCKDGTHSAWMIVDVESKADAQSIVSPALRGEARVTALNTFTIAQIESVLSDHNL